MSSSVPCPTCKRPVEWSEAFPWRPFCSERCKLIDLGGWASGQRAIPGDVVETDDKPKDADDAEDDVEK